MSWVEALWAPYTEVVRQFQFDYVYFDLVFLVAWVLILFLLRERKALLFGLIIAPLIFSIDAGIWWHSSIDGPAGAAFVREYWIGGQYVAHSTGALPARKIAADFMMTISYALYAFPWLWIGFSAIQKRSYRRAVCLTGIWLAFWLLVPLLSEFFPVDDTPIRAVRHMQNTYSIWFCAVVIGYAIAFVVYRNELRIPCLLFVQGAVGALIMEVPLQLGHIRPTSVGFLIFEAVVLLNQAVPFLFLVYDKAIPMLVSRFNKSGLHT